MHYSIFIDRAEIGFFPYIENLCFTWIDVCIIYAIPLLLINKKTFLFFIPYGILLVYIFANLCYSRYFFNYLPPSLYLEVGNLNGLSSNISAAVRPQDLTLIITSLILICYYIRFHRSMDGIPHRTRLKSFFIIIGIILIIVISMIFLSKRNWPTLKSKFIAPYTYATSESNFKFGMIHSNIVQIVTEKKKEYSPQILKELQPYFTSNAYTPDESRQNIIIILVESLLSYATDLKIDGKEMTPNLNKLSKEAGSYYNNNMTSSIQLGESSDGQFIYLTGLLPNKQGVTIIDYFDNTFNAIPCFLKKKNSSTQTQMIIPTTSKMWRQDAMCKKYDIDRLYSRMEYEDASYQEKWLDDKRLFEYAAQQDKKEKQPFFSLILTSSTHTPYNKEHEPCDINFPKEYSEQLKVYLSNVHYMDKYLGKYMESLKEKGIYDNTMIVIMSDHPVSKEWLNAEQMPFSLSIPLFIINAPVKIEKESNVPISQEDVFPTILDLMGIDSPWRGVGNSLLTPDSIRQSKTQRERTDKKQQISDIILNSDYFKEKPI